jgi:hypothetical protein
MIHTFHIDDSHPNAKAFLVFLRTLDFISQNETNMNLNEEQAEAIEEARASLKQNGGSSHDEVMQRMKAKFPDAFRS